MNNSLRVRVLLAIFVLVAAGSPAQVPGLLNFQGRVLVNGIPFDGTGRFKFALVNGGGTAAYWSQDGTATGLAPQPTGSVRLTVSQGQYSLLLGDATIPGMLPVPLTVFTNSDVRLRVWFDDGSHGFQQLIPDQRVAAVGYAMVAGTLAPGAITADKLEASFASTLARLNGNPIFNGNVTAGRFLGDGSGVTGVDAVSLGGMDAGHFWKHNGNTGTQPGIHFIGTTDDRPLELRAANQPGLRLQRRPAGADIGESVLFIGGHASNTVADGVSAATIAGGGTAASPNRIEEEGTRSTIGGGTGNRIRAAASVVAGGWNNLISEDSWFAVIGGGSGNFVGRESRLAVITGGADHGIGTNSPAAVIGGGWNNAVGVSAGGSAIAGGERNGVGAMSAHAMIGGGERNDIFGSASHATLGGGATNRIRAYAVGATLGGGMNNEIGVEAVGGTLVGGARNRLGSRDGFLGGGRDNELGTNCLVSLIVGGGENVVGDNVDGGVVLGGFRNAIRGGPFQSRRDIGPAVLSGSDNEIRSGSSWALIAGGDHHRIGENSACSVVAGGTNCIVADDCSFAFAAGRRAHVQHPGSFVWSDSRNEDFASRGTNTFNVRATGGLHLDDDTSLFLGSSTRQAINLYSQSFGIGVQSATHYSRTRSGGTFSWFEGGSHVDSANTPGAGGTELMRLSGSGLRVNGTFVSASDRNLKKEFRPVDTEAMLARVAALPIAEWSYKQDASVRHVGPMAQDFHASFGVGEDDRHIAMVDADGVALAAIQGLNRKLEAEVKAKEERIEQLEQRLADLERLVSDLATRGNGGQP